jgi:hypothetical protein
MKEPTPEAKTSTIFGDLWHDSSRALPDTVLLQEHRGALQRIRRLRGGWGLA